MKRALVTSIVMTCLILMLTAAVSVAEIAVIVNSGNSNAVSRDMVEKIYSGDLNLWPAGGAVNALDLPADSADRASFTTGLLGKSVPAMKALWAAKLFSGRATPPKMLGSEGDVKRAVAGNKNAIGYINASSVDGSVKVVLTIK